MTDHPRFRPRKGEFEAAYRDHHGGRLVHLMLRLVERGGRTGGTVRAAVAGILAVLALSGVVQVLGALKGADRQIDSTVAASIRPGAR